MRIRARLWAALLALCAVMVWAVPVRSALTGAPDLSEIDAFVEEQMARHRIPGLALVITHGDQIIYQRGFGTAGGGRPVTSQTPFYIGSISKSFTALAIMQLAEEGRIDLDAPVQRYLPWFRVADRVASQAITVRHLLHQTSGLAESTYLADLPLEATLQDVVWDLRRAAPVDPPGTAFHYFNQNYATLGLIVQQVSGQPYGDYVQRQILEPLEMERSAATMAGIAQLDVAQGHGMLFGFPIARQQEMAAHGMPEGGIVSTAKDMGHWLIAHNNGGRYGDARLLSAEGMARLHAPDTPGAPQGEGYAMGWIVEPRNGTATLHHGGSLENFRAFAWLLPEQEYGLAVLINQNAFVPAMLAYSNIPAGIADLLIGVEPAAGPAMRTLYGGVTVLLAALVALDLRWWWMELAGNRRRTASRPPARLWLGMGGSLLRAALFSALPYLIMGGLDRGFRWRDVFVMAPTVYAFIAWNVAMGCAKCAARVFVWVRKERNTV